MDWAAIRTGSWVGLTSLVGFRAPEPGTSVETAVVLLRLLELGSLTVRTCIKVGWLAAVVPAAGTVYACARALPAVVQERKGGGEGAKVDPRSKELRRVLQQTTCGLWAWGLLRQLGWFQDRREAPFHMVTAQDLKDAGFDKAVMLVAAQLSHWVYDARPCQRGGATPQPPMALAQALPGVEVQAVLHQPRRCAAKLASVVVTLPCGRADPNQETKVLFWVFKGTSLVFDVLNWNTEHNRERMVAFRDLIIHQGCAGTIWNLDFLHGDYEHRLRTAAADGLQHFVLTGHSLGGMYALTSMVHVWRLWHAHKGLDSLLASARCVTFGSPMVFGTDGEELVGTDAEFRNFIRSRAINFALEDDPCPRAWGVLEFRHRDWPARLLQWVWSCIVHGGLSVGGACGLASGVAFEVLVAYVRLHRETTFSGIFAPCHSYEHFSEVQLLSRNKHTAPWHVHRPSLLSVQNHSMDLYCRALCECLLASPFRKMYRFDGKGDLLAAA